MLVGQLVLSASTACADDELVLHGGVNTDRYWEIGSGLQIGEVHLLVNHGHLFAELSTVIGVPLATMGAEEGAVGAAVLAVGYGLPFAHDGRGLWVFDVYLLGVGGRLRMSGSPGEVGALGFGFGFRWLLDGGWVVGMRMPCFGMTLEEYSRVHTFSPSASVADFFAVTVFGSTVLTVGYRF